MKWIFLFILLSTFVSAACVDVSDGMIITESTTFCGKTYDIPNGITITGDNIVIDCGSAILRGIIDESEIGIIIENSHKITVKNCNIITFNQGMFIKNVTNSLIEQNAILKNRIGIRMLDSYENVIRDNNDRSRQVPVSAINSKFNVIMLGNRNIDREFCEFNSCNEFREMNVCESGDFYCSSRCSYKTDDDCPPPKIEQVTQEKPPEKTADELIEEAKKEVEAKYAETPKEDIPKKTKLPSDKKLFIYAALYGIAFITLQVRKKR